MKINGLMLVFALWSGMTDGKIVYELELWKGNTENDVDIDEATGRVRNCDVESYRLDWGMT